jgi:hypothetical protein
MLQAISQDTKIKLGIELIYLPQCNIYLMAGDTETVKAKPPRYFSTLYYRNQKNRQKLPTAEEQSELEKLKTDYEGKRYQIPEDMLDIENSGDLQKRINHDYENLKIQDNDIRWYRQHSIHGKKSDYDYRYWLQYEVEKMASGERSMKGFADDKDKEYEDAMGKLYELSFEFSKALVELAEDQHKRESFKKNPLGNLYIWEKKILSDDEINNRVKKLFGQDRDFWNPFLSNPSFGSGYEPDGDVTRIINEHPIFYNISKEVVKILFKTINKATYRRGLKKNELISVLKSLGIKIELPLTKRKLWKMLIKELEEPGNKEKREDLMSTGYLVSLNQLMSRMHNDLRNVMQKWHKWVSAANTSNKNHYSMPKKAKDVYNLGFDFPEGESLNSNQEKVEKQTESSIRLSLNCIYLLFEKSMIDISIPDLKELDYIYSEEYGNSGKSQPNIARLNQGFQEKHLNQGEHAIIRHFNKDQKRNMYCLPKNHKKDVKGGFLKLSKSKSQPADLERLIESGKIKHQRFEFSQSTLDSLNSLQKTQWSINLDFLDFIAELTDGGEVVDPYPINIRQSAWKKSDNMKLRDIFITSMELNKLDQSTLSRMMTINSILKQSRKNIYNAPNVFWHSWSCDWRGRFNCRTPEISPQGADLSKSLLLFNEWKIIGERGKYWLYVRAYDLLHHVIGGSREKFDSFDKKVESVEENLNEYLEIGNKLYKYPIQAKTLDDLKGPKKWKDSEIFQKIAFLIEFIRIHDELKKNYNQWDKVKSGLPIHLDASCNGFQHISALTRNKPLAKSVNLISENNTKKDLYQEVADLAGEKFETSDLKQLLCKFGLNEHELQEFKRVILVRELCKPLVMVKGYGARDLQSPICNKGGKKNGKFGSYSSKGKRKRTIHPESILFDKLERLSDKNKCKGFEQFLFSEGDKEGRFEPTENCEKAERLARGLVEFIGECIKKKTEGAFEEINKKLTNIINREFKLLEDKIYLKWKITDQGSSIRNIKWKLKDNRGKTKLNIEVLPKGYCGDNEETIHSFLLKSISKEDKVKLNKSIEKIKEIEKEKGKLLPTHNHHKRRLKSRIFYYLRNIYNNESESKEIRIAARNHLRARFINGKGRKRTDYGVTIDAKYTMDNFDSLSTEDKEKLITELTNKIKTGLVPNFIHSFDAVHMQMVILELNKRGIEDIWSVHDSFGVHACHVEEMREIVKQTFVELHREPLDKHIENIVKLNSDILKSDDEQINQEGNDKIQNNSTENNGDSDWINEVLESEYMIS